MEIIIFAFNINTEFCSNTPKAVVYWDVDDKFIIKHLWLGNRDIQFYSKCNFFPRSEFYGKNSLSLKKWLKY